MSFGMQVGILNWRVQPDCLINILYLFRYIAKQLNLPWRQIDRFAALQKQLQCSLSDMIKYADSLLTQTTYNLSELLTLFEIEEEDFKQNLLSHNTQHLQEFKMRQRALHVLEGILSYYHIILQQILEFSIMH